MIIEPIQQALSIAGIDLVFQDFDILGIPGFNTSVLYKGEVSLYEVEKQNFSFQVATIDTIDNQVAIDMLFTMEDSGYQYQFRLDRPPVNDLTGWSELHALLLSVVIL